MKLRQADKKQKTYRLSPSLVAFIEKYADNRRWKQTTVIEYALEELAKREGYNLKDFESNTIA